MYGHGAGFLIRVDVIEDQRLDVAVENNSDQFALPIDDWTSGIATDDVGGADEVEWCRRIESCPALLPNCRQLERILILVLRSVFDTCRPASYPRESFVPLPCIP